MAGVECQTLGILCEMPVFDDQCRKCLHVSFGRVVDDLAPRFGSVKLCAPMRKGGPDATREYTIRSGNVQLLPQPYYATSQAALKHPIGIACAYWRLCRRCDAIFVRGMLPYVGLFYLMARLFGRRPVHWIVGNPIALLRSHKRSSFVKDCLSTAYALQDRFFTKLGRWLTGGAFICNGEELAKIYRSPRTKAVVSSTITENEFFERADTCQGSEIRLLFVGFVRPEKGLEYLFEALSKLRLDRPWRLTVVGPTDTYPEYKTRLDQQAALLGITDRIDWAGYVSCGPQLWEYLRSHDVFVFPSLSEGTPRVLVEARANSLPVVATNVGGIPTSVQNGYDGLLVDPKNPAALADAISKVVTNGDLRRCLIRNGLAAVGKFTVKAFVNTVVAEMEG
jgi:glycosyltransferase involved in cell wall biosynthesis